MDYRRYFDDNQDIIEELKQNPANEILKVDTSVRVRRTQSQMSFKEIDSDVNHLGRQCGIQFNTETMMPLNQQNRLGIKPKFSKIAQEYYKQNKTKSIFNSQILGPKAEYIQSFKKRFNIKGFAPGQNGFEVSESDRQLRDNFITKVYYNPDDTYKNFLKYSQKIGQESSDEDKLRELELQQELRRKRLELEELERLRKLAEEEELQRLRIEEEERLRLLEEERLRLLKEYNIKLLKRQEEAKRLAEEERLKRLKIEEEERIRKLYEQMEQEEILRKIKEEEERRRREEEERRRREEEEKQRMEEERRRREEEERIRLLELERLEKLRLADKEEYERQKKLFEEEELRRKKEQEVAKTIQLQELERLRQAEIQRLKQLEELLRLQKLKEEEERLRREEEDRLKREEEERLRREEDERIRREQEEYLKKLKDQEEERLKQEEYERQRRLLEEIENQRRLLEEEDLKRRQQEEQERLRREKEERERKEKDERERLERERLQRLKEEEERRLREAEEAERQRLYDEWQKKEAEIFNKLKNKEMEAFLDEYENLKQGNPDYQELSDHNFFFKLNNLNLFNQHIQEKILDMKKFQKIQLMQNLIEEISDSSDCSSIQNNIQDNIMINTDELIELDINDILQNNKIQSNNEIQQNNQMQSNNQIYQDQKQIDIYDNKQSIGDIIGQTLQQDNNYKNNESQDQIHEQVNQKQEQIETQQQQQQQYQQQQQQQQQQQLESGQQQNESNQQQFEFIDQQFESDQQQYEINQQQFDSNLQYQNQNLKQESLVDYDQCNYEQQEQNLYQNQELKKQQSVLSDEMTQQQFELDMKIRQLENFKNNLKRQSTIKRKSILEKEEIEQKTLQSILQIEQLQSEKQQLEHKIIEQKDNNYKVLSYFLSKKIRIKNEYNKIKQKQYPLDFTRKQIQFSQFNFNDLKQIYQQNQFQQQQIQIDQNIDKIVENSTLGHIRSVCKEMINKQNNDTLQVDIKQSEFDLKKIFLYDIELGNHQIKVKIKYQQKSFSFQVYINNTGDFPTQLRFYKSELNEQDSVLTIHLRNINVYSLIQSFQLQNINEIFNEILDISLTSKLILDFQNNLIYYEGNFNGHLKLDIQQNIFQFLNLNLVINQNSQIKIQSNVDFYNQYYEVQFYKFNQCAQYQIVQKMFKEISIQKVFKYLIENFQANLYKIREFIIYQQQNNLICHNN